MKSILMIASGIVMFSSTQLFACPLMNGKQKVTELDQQEQSHELVVEGDLEKIDPLLLAKLLLEKEEPIN